MSKLGKKIELLSGQHIEASNTNSSGKGVPYLTGPADFVGKKPIATKYTEFPKVCCDKGDILITVKGSGTGSIAISDATYCISRQLMAVRCKDINPFFAQYLLELNEKKFNSSAAGLIPGISRTDVLNLKIPHVQLPEQKAIADLLSTWDEAIEKTERLIRAKEKQLDAYARDLFDHKNDGKYQGWKVIKLKNVLTEHGDKSTGSEEVYSVSVHKGLVNQVEHLGRSFSAVKTDNYNRVHYGDIIYTKSPTGDFPIGIVKQSYTIEDVIVSPLYGVFTPRTFNLGIILDFYFSSPIRARNYLFPIVQKGAKNTIAITNKTFLSKSLHLPVDEKVQKVIAEIVSAAREEIDLLKQLARKYKIQKRGLMQKVLTGEWRVKPEIVMKFEE